MTDVVYAAISGEPKLSVYHIDSASGRLGLASEATLSGNPGALATSPDLNYLYAGINVDDRHEIHSFRIERHSGGSLEQIGGIDIGANPCHLSTDNTGRFLLGAYYSDGMATVHPIGTDGAVADPRVQRVDTAPKAHYIQTDAANRYAFVPHVCDANVIFQFGFDEATGVLTPNPTPTASPGTPEGPRHMCFHPNGRFAFSDGEQGSSVTAWSYDSDAGKLTPLQTLSTLPDGWEGDNSCSQIHITPDGRSVYACNRGHHSLAGFRIDAGTGALELIGIFATDPVPRPLTIDPSGRYVYVAGTENRLGAFAIDAGNGGLTPLPSCDTGPVSWVLSARLS